MQLISKVTEIVVWTFLIGCVLFNAAIACCCIWSNFRALFGLDRVTSEQRRKAKEKNDALLLEPSPNAVEQLLGGRLPISISELYANHELLLRSHICFKSRYVTEEGDEWNVDLFTPCRVEAQNHVLSDLGEPYVNSEGAFRFFEFANDGCDGFFYVQLHNEQQDDAPVYVLFNDDAVFLKLADGLREFLAGVLPTQVQ